MKPLFELRKNSMQAVKRNMKIIKSQIKFNNPKEVAKLFRNALFKCEDILVYKREIDVSSKINTMRDDAIQIKQGDEADIQAATQQITPVPWEFQCHRYDGVNLFFIAKENNKILHISWVYFAQDINRILVLKKDEAEIKFCLTLSNMRGRGIYPSVLKEIVIFLSKMRIRNVFICVKENNRASIKGIEKAGFTKVTQIKLKKVLGFQLSSKLDTKGL